MPRDLTRRPDSHSAVVERTIPRGSSKEDHDPTPALMRETWSDHVRVARAGCPEALARLVREYERYARSLATRMHRGNEPREDLDQIALEALVMALKRFDPDRSIPFPAFATPTILGALRRHYRDHGWLVRVPRPVHELASALREANERLAATLGRPATDGELTEELGLTPEELRAATTAIRARDARSLDATLDGERSLGDQLGNDDPELGLAEDRLAASAAFEHLEDRERRLLWLYYIEEKTQTEIAEVLGISQMQVSRLLGAALRHVRQLATAA